AMDDQAPVGRGVDRCFGQAEGQGPGGGCGRETTSRRGPPPPRGEKTATHRLRSAFSASASIGAPSLPSPPLSKRFTIPLTSRSLRPGILPSSSASSLPSPSLSCRRITSFASSTKSTLLRVPPFGNACSRTIAISLKVSSPYTIRFGGWLGLL